MQIVRVWVTFSAVAVLYSVSQKSSPLKTFCNIFT